jgi:hypothetical protein
MRHQAIYNTHSSVTHIFADNEAYDGEHNLVTLDEAKVQTETLRLQAEYDAQAYARNRAEEYPPLADQLDHIFHNGVASWKTNIVQPVKDKYPKPE